MHILLYLVFREREALSSAVVIYDNRGGLARVGHYGVLLAHYCCFVHESIVGASLLLGQVVVVLKHPLSLFSQICNTVIVKVS